jgi:hypothetical protein
VQISGRVLEPGSVQEQGRNSKCCDPGVFAPCHDDSTFFEGDTESFCARIFRMWTTVGARHAYRNNTLKPKSM